MFIIDAFKKTIETFGGLDIVVNNAGVGGEADDNWERCVDVNMVGTVYIDYRDIWWSIYCGQ